MENIHWEWSLFKPLVPKRALEYLQKKPNYLAIWKTIIPYYFSEKKFCDIINEIRSLLIQRKKEIDRGIKTLEDRKNDTILDVQENIKLKKLKEQKKIIGYDIVTEVFAAEVFPIIKNTAVDYKSIKQLIGSLLNISKTTQEYITDITKWVNYNLHEDLSGFEGYEDDILLIRDGLINELFAKDGIGGSMSEGEEKEFRQQAWTIFLNNHKQDIDQWKIDIKKLSKHLYYKKII